MALLDDPKLLLEAPATPPTGVDHLKPADLRTVLMHSHKDIQLQLTRHLGGPGRMATVIVEPRGDLMWFVSLRIVDDEECLAVCYLDQAHEENEEPIDIQVQCQLILTPN
jgi:hypothetical protein